MAGVYYEAISRFSDKVGAEQIKFANENPDIFRMVVQAEQAWRNAGS